MLNSPHSSSTGKISRRRAKPISYSPEALGWDLSRVRDAWDAYQETRERDAIYIYLTELFELVQCWEAEGEAISRARRAAKVQEIISGRPGEIEPFAAIISCTADRRKADAKTRSKWSRALRYAEERRATVKRCNSSSSEKAVSTNALHGMRAIMNWACDELIKKSTFLNELTFPLASFRYVSKAR